jgi:hypothetical protein
MLRTAVPYPALKTNPVPQRSIFFALCSEPARTPHSPTTPLPPCMAQDSAVTGTAAVHTAQSVLLHMCSHSVQ